MWLMPMMDASFQMPTRFARVTYEEKLRVLNVCNWPGAADYSLSVLKGFDVWQDCRMGPNPLLAQVRRYRA